MATENHEVRMFLLRWFKYLLISSLLTSVLTVGVFGAWKMGYIMLPEPAERVLAMTEELVWNSEELAAAKQQLNAIIEDQRLQQGSVRELDSVPPNEGILSAIEETVSSRKIYRWRDAEGNLFITDSAPPKGVKAEEILVDDGPKVALSRPVVTATEPAPGGDPKAPPDITTLFSGDSEAIKAFEEIRKQRETERGE